MRNIDKGLKTEDTGFARFRECLQGTKTGRPESASFGVRTPIPPRADRRGKEAREEWKLCKEALCTACANGTAGLHFLYGTQ
jgi:hypothetical protein